MTSEAIWLMAKPGFYQVSQIHQRAGSWHLPMACARMKGEHDRKHLCGVMEGAEGCRTREPWLGKPGETRHGTHDVIGTGYLLSTQTASFLSLPSSLRCDPFSVQDFLQ